MTIDELTLERFNPTNPGKYRVYICKMTPDPLQTDWAWPDRRACWGGNQYPSFMAAASYCEAHRPGWMYVAMQHNWKELQLPRDEFLALLREDMAELVGGV
jgi:hypothetical protein